MTGTFTLYARSRIIVQRFCPVVRRCTIHAYSNAYYCVFVGEEYILPRTFYVVWDALFLFLVFLFVRFGFALFASQIDASAARTCFLPLQRLAEACGTSMAYAGLTVRMETLLRYVRSVDHVQSLFVHL